MVDDYSDNDDDDDDDATEDELQTRKGKFLPVEAVNGGYRETAVSGNIAEYRVNERELEIGVENIALHVTSNVLSGSLRHLLTGMTCEKFRAIGTEGDYRILNVTIGSETDNGTAVIRHVYEKNGHALRSKMSIGLPDETVKGLGERLPGNLRISGIEKQKFYTADAHNEALLHDYWRHHVSDDGSDEVTVEWQFKFDTVTLSPEGYSPLWEVTTHRRIMGGALVGTSEFTFLRDTPLSKSLKV